MNKFQKIILLCCLFSYAFSLKVTKIEPSTATLGERVEFTLIVQDYDPSKYYTFYLTNDGDDSKIDLSCPSSSESTTTLKCTADIRLKIRGDLNNLTKTLFLDDEKTNLTVTIEKPKSLKLLDFNGEQYYSYSVSRLEFNVNLNELYKSDFSIKFGEFSITNCSLEEDSIRYINCYYAFPENLNEQTLKLKFGNEETNYSITINAPKEFSSINELNIEEYYISSSEQDLLFYVDSAYKMDEHKFKLVPESTNENITLSKCTIYGVGIYHGKCSGILNKSDAYYVFVDDKNTTLKLFVYPVPTAITSVDEIEPDELEISSSATTFTLEVDYVVNLDKAVFTLVDEYDDNNKVYLTKCKKVDNSVYEITCEGTIKNAGKYYVYLNGIKQGERVRALSSSLSKALDVEPKLKKFDELNIESYITIYFDSMRDFSSKKIALKGNENEATLKISYKYYYYTEYKATFTSADTYYVYIDDVKQDVNILVTKDDFTSKVTAISPTLVPSGKTNTFTLTVDTNLGVETVNLYIQNKDDKDSDDDLSCKADSSDKTKAICRGYTEKEGVYYVKFKDGTEFKDVTVTAKNIPSLNSFSPISISPSSKEQNITLIFDDNISIFVDKIKFIVGTETVETKCTAESNYVLYCSAVFNNEDDYFITIDGVNTGKFINVNEDDNINEEEEKKKNSVNYLKISSLLLALLLLF
jgi:hypothetical protein